MVNKELKKCDIAKFRPNPSSYSAPRAKMYIDIPLPESITHIPRGSFETITARIYVYLTNPTSKVVENDGKIIIGLDLSKGFEYQLNAHNLERGFGMALYSPDEAKKQSHEFSNIIFKELGVTEDNFEGSFSDTYVKHFYETSIWKDAVKYLQSIYDKLEVTLNDKEYPYSPRNLLPIFTFDSETGVGWFHNQYDTYGMTWRRYHMDLDFDNVRQDTAKLAIACLAFSLVHIGDPSKNAEYSLYT
jgi:hypothetical protein